jgi:hypothetical protein
MTTPTLTPIEARPLTWLPFTALDDYWQETQWRYRGDRAKHQLYAWDELSQCYIFRDDDDSPYIVATGQQLNDARIPAFSAAHLWVAKPGDVSRVQYAKLYQVVASGGTQDDIAALIEQRQQGKISYQKMIDALVEMGATGDDVVRVRCGLNYKSGWEHYVMEKVG